MINIIVGILTVLASIQSVSLKDAVKDDIADNLRFAMPFLEQKESGKFYKNGSHLVTGTYYFEKDNKEYKIDYVVDEIGYDVKRYLVKDKSQQEIEQSDPGSLTSLSHVQADNDQNNSGRGDDGKEKMVGFGNFKVPSGSILGSLLSGQGNVRPSGIYSQLGQFNGAANKEYSGFVPEVSSSQSPTAFPGFGAAYLGPSSGLGYSNLPMDRFQPAYIGISRVGFPGYTASGLGDSGSTGLPYAPATYGGGQSQLQSGLHHSGIPSYPPAFGQFGIPNGRYPNPSIGLDFPKTPLQPGQAGIPTSWYPTSSFQQEKFRPQDNPYSYIPPEPAKFGTHSGCTDRYPTIPTYPIKATSYSGQIGGGYAGMPPAPVSEELLNALLRG